MRTNVLLWTVAALLTLVLGFWQRVSGPTYPIYGRATLGAAAFKYKLERTHAGPGDAVIVVTPGAPVAHGTLRWRDHEPVGAWSEVPLTSLSSKPGALAAPIPHHAAPQKVDYQVVLEDGGATVTLPPQGVATLRFRNDVPWWILIPHIIVMMGALLVAVRAFFEALRPQPKLDLLVLRALAATFIGGFPLGCAVSGYAFGQPWGGFPLGNDATDNKTLVAFVGWAVAAAAVRMKANGRAWTIVAALLMFVVYLVPHSFVMPH